MSWPQRAGTQSWWPRECEWGSWLGAVLLTNSENTSPPPTMLWLLQGSSKKLPASGQLLGLRVLQGTSGQPGSRNKMRWLLPVEVCMYQRKTHSHSYTSVCVHACTHRVCVWARVCMLSVHMMCVCSLCI